MRTALLLLAFLAVPALAAQTVWKWVDGEGVTHYSDRPAPGATKVEIASSNRADSGRTDPPSVSAPASEQPEPAGPPYRNLEIWQPSQGEAIINTGGQVTVNVRVEPVLRPGHNLYLYMDGRLVEGFPPDTTSFTLEEVPRGMHRLVAVISENRGTRVQESEPVTFMVRQESIANPPVGPALRPPPKPNRGASNKLPGQQPSFAALNGARAPVDPRTNLPPPRKKGD